MRSIADLLFDKACRDLEVARLSHAQDSQLYADQILYLCHQAAEKAMKAALVADAEVPHQTHDLRLLGEHLEVHDPAWSSLSEAAELLNAHGHVARYLESLSDAELAEQAIAAASAILQHAECNPPACRTEGTRGRLENAISCCNHPYGPPRAADR